MANSLGIHIVLQFLAMEGECLYTDNYFDLGFGSTTNTGFGKPFGTTTPATGTGLFGSTPAATATGFGTGFGTAAATTGAFGSTTTPASTAGSFGKPFGATTTTAGATGGLFGTAPAANTGFGTGNAIGFGSSAGTDVPVTGTSNPVFSATQEKDPAGSSMNHFQTISMMPAYQKFSLEVGRDNVNCGIFQMLIHNEGIETARPLAR